MKNVKAVFWDFGGVITSSPFEAFQTYELEAGLPADLIRKVNSINPDANAWAQFERSEIDRRAFCALFEAETAALGHKISGEAVLNRLQGKPRPEMVQALKLARQSLIVACLTNNVANLNRPPEQAAEIARIMELFHLVVESSKVGVRKPEPEFYRIALEMAGVQADETVFLDDLGVNLKPARQMGMRTIKVVEPKSALAELSEMVGLPFSLGA